MPIRYQKVLSLYENVDSVHQKLGEPQHCCFIADLFYKSTIEILFSENLSFDFPLHKNKMK